MFEIRIALALLTTVAILPAQTSRAALEKKVSVARAELKLRQARLASVEAEEKLRYSERLLAKGFITARERDADRGQRDRASTALEIAERELAQARTREHTAASLPDPVRAREDWAARLTAAKKRVALVEQELERTEQLHARGFVARDELREDRDAVATARAEVELCRQHLALHQRRERGELTNTQLARAQQKLELKLAIERLERRSEQAELRLSRTHQLRAKDFVSAADLRRDEIALWNVRSELRITRLELELLTAKPERARDK